MFRFRIELAVAAVLAGCGGHPPRTALCGKNTPDGYARFRGYVEIGESNSCPSAASLSGVSQGGCPCPVIETTVVCELSSGPVVFAEHPWVPDTSRPVEAIERNVCWYDAVGESTGICCGRPLTTADGATVAPVARRAGWASGDLPEVRGLSPALRRLLADEALGVAAMEHASVAAFSRVVLALLRHGAPASLVADTQRAADDEVRHAARAYALASAYAGETLAPGPLDLSGVHALDTLEDLARATVLEGCIGETLAALEAAQQLAGTTDAAVRRTLAQVVADESDHAALAWRTLAWLLSVAPWLRAVVADSFTTRPMVPSRVAVPDARGHGYLGAAERQAAWSRAWDDVVLPSWRSLAS